MKALPFQHFLTEDEKRVRSSTKEFVDRSVRPYALEDDRLCRFRRESYTELGKSGLTRLSTPQSLGGQGLSYRCYYAAIEEIARGSASLAVTTSVTNMIQSAIVQYGNEQQKTHYLPKILSGEWIAAFSLSEPGSGTDAAALQCQAKKEGNQYRINGTKLWCSSAGVADLYLLMARTGEERYKGISSFLVEAKTPGFRVGKQEKKLGLRASPLAELIFENCVISPAQRLGPEGDGFKIALSQLDAGRVTIGAVGAGIAQEALEIAIARGVQGESLELLADDFAELQALKLLVVEAGRLRDENLPLTVIASMTKLIGSNLAVRTASNVIDLLGPLGATEEYKVERLLRDAKALQIVEGANQIQRSLIGRALGEKH